MKVSFRIEGAAEFERNLATLGRRVQKKVVKGAVHHALKPMQATARTNARNLRGAGTKRFRGMSSLIAKHIIVKRSGTQRPGSYAAQVMMRPKTPELVHTAKKTGRESYIPAAIEYGHGSNKEAAARPFMRPAADSRQAETMRVLARDLRTGLLREAMKGRST